MALVKATANAAGSYFKPKDFERAFALLIEPKSIDRDVPNTYNGVTNTRDEVLADVSVFNSALAVETGVPDQDIKNVKITHAGLVNKVRNGLGDQYVGTVGMTTPSNGRPPYWDLLDPSDDVFALVADYFEKREAAVKAAVESDDMSDFE